MLAYAGQRKSVMILGNHLQGCPFTSISIYNEKLALVETITSKNK